MPTAPRLAPLELISSAKAEDGAPDEPLGNGPTAERWRKAAWIDRAARILRAGEGLGPDDDLDALLTMSKADIAARLMESPRFGDAILDFNLYFLGFKSDSLRSGSHYDRSVFDFPNAVAAAQAAVAGGDYFRLFDFEGPFFMAPLRTEPLEDPPLPEDAGLAPSVLRAKAIGELRERFDDLLEFAVENPTKPVAVCGRVKALVDQSAEVTARLYRAFDDAEIFALIRGEAVSEPLAQLQRVHAVECTAERRPKGAGRRIAEAVLGAHKQVARAFEEVLRFEPSIYQPATVEEFRTFDLKALPTRQKWSSFGFEQGMALANSSTNFNRKRAAYVLKRFFCDDLIPIGFENPVEHTGGAHGSQTTCYACHHKLDPMAGFFRTLGAYFFDYGDREDIVFDDLATKSRRAYEQTWQPGRARSIGFIRSPRWEGSNRYGSSMTDLGRIVRGAPEAKSCLMKRLHEYVVAPDQTIDRGYLDHLTRSFEADAAEGSARALRKAIVRLLESNAFAEPDAEPTRCYDAAPGAVAASGPPCRVAAILAKNCGQCHYSVLETKTGRLDLNSWVPTADGRGQTFRHLDGRMAQLPAQESLSRIIERLSTHDPAQRMPKGRVMPSDERQELFLWAQQEATAIGSGSAR